MNCYEACNNGEASILLCNTLCNLLFYSREMLTPRPAGGEMPIHDSHSEGGILYFTSVTVFRFSYLGQYICIAKAVLRDVVSNIIITTEDTLQDSQ